jgi:hypothetical protein
MTLCLTNRKKKFFLAGYFYGCPLDPYVVLSPPRGAAGGDEFRVQSFGEGSSGFIQPVWLALAQYNMFLNVSSNLYYLSLALPRGHFVRPVFCKMLINLWSPDPK